MLFIRQNRAILVAAAIVVGGLTVIMLKVVVTDDPLMVVENDTEPVAQSEEEASQDPTITEEETAELPDVKQDEPRQTEEPEGTSEVVPQITSAPVENGKLSVRGFVPQILEDGGTCTYRLLASSGALIESAETSGFADVSSTICPVSVIDVSEIDSGNYVVELEYSSDNYSGESALFEVPI